MENGEEFFVRLELLYNRDTYPFQLKSDSQIVVEGRQLGRQWIRQVLKN